MKRVLTFLLLALPQHRGGRQGAAQLGRFHGCEGLAVEIEDLLQAVRVEDAPHGEGLAEELHLRGSHLG